MSFYCESFADFQVVFILSEPMFIANVFLHCSSVGPIHMNTTDEVLASITREQVDSNPIRCPDASVSESMIKVSGIVYQCCLLLQYV